MSEHIPMSLPDIDESDVEAVAEVVRSGRLALGPKTTAFEEAVAGYVGVKHAVAVSSGTAALHLLVRALGIGAGDEVLVPSFTFAASVNAILYVGAVPVFVDIEKDTFNIDPEDMERKITAKTRAVMVVDIFGHPAEWDAISRIAEEHGLRVIDDSCEALGAEYKGRKLGQFGDAGAFAFYPNKQLTTGEGGIIVTDDDRVADLCRSLCNQGRGRMGAWLEHERLGYNYRMDEMSAALGLSQMKRIESFLAKRQGVAEMYNEKFAPYEWIAVPTVRDHVRISWFVYVVMLAEGIDRDAVIGAMGEKDIPVRAYFPPLHQQPFVVERIEVARSVLGVTEAIARRTLAIPFHNNLREEQIYTVVSELAAVTGVFTR